MSKFPKSGPGPPGPETLAAAKLNATWDLLNVPNEDKSEMVWPTVTDVYSDLRSNGYNSVFEATHDLKTSQKILCPNGIMCTFRIDWFGNSSNRYTGMFQRAEYGIMRMSSALGDISGYLPFFAGKIKDSKLFPCVALKLFRDSTHSVNLVFGGKKTGQPEEDFFQHSVCTNLTEKVSLWMQWIIALFRLYSYYPTQSGMSEFASTKQNGEVVSQESVNFPWCLLLRPVYQQAASLSHDADVGIDTSGSSEAEADTSSLVSSIAATPVQLAPYMHQLLSIPSGSILYDIYAIPTPAAAMGVLAYMSGPTEEQDKKHIHRIGRLTTTSPCIWSARDKDIFFKHQRKEEDYILRPDWESELVADHANVGAANIDKLIDLGAFLDLEDGFGEN